MEKPPGTEQVKDPRAGRNGLQARKQKLVRDAIWDAAIDLFAEHGFDETTVEQITQAAGVSQRSFFRYFASKSDLMGQSTLGLGAALSEAIAACPAKYTAAEVMREAVRAVVRLAEQYSRTEKVMEIAAKYASAREAQMSRMGEMQNQVRQAFSKRGGKAARKGDLKAQLLAAITITLFDLTLRTWLERGRRDLDGTLDQVFATLRDAVG